MKKGFTLIELMLVLVILSFILGIAFRMSGQSVTELKLKNEIAQFQTSYNKNLSRILSSSYIGDFRYISATTIIQSGDNTISYIFSGNGDNYLEETFHFYHQNIIRDSNDEETLILSSKPNQVGCIINNQENIRTGTFILSSDMSNPNCFTVDANTCKIKKTKCIIEN